MDGARCEREARLVSTYLEELRGQRRMALHTLNAYRRDLGVLLAHAAAGPLDRLSSADIRRLVASQTARGLSARSLARMLSAWRGFFSWLVRKHGAKVNPCLGVRPPKTARMLPAALSPDQVAAMLGAEAQGALELRDKAMFELLYSSGLRLAELAGLNEDAAGPIAAGEVTVTGKRGKTRLVPVGHPAREAIGRWLRERAELADAGEPALFVSRRGGRLSARAIEARLERWSRRLGVPVRVHPHVLRHSFASHLLQSSGDLRAVQEMLGHASIASTQIYTHLDFQHLARVYDAAHPRARKR
jgi:integrase/recombinase XerC